jgi:hypothetical protein
VTRYTTAELLALIAEEGYDLSREDFEQLTINKLMPSRPAVPVPGKPGRYSLWSDQHLGRLRDLCWLKTLNRRTEPVRLGLWLLGHDTDKIRDNLAKQFDWIQSRISAQASTDPSQLDEHGAFEIEKFILDTLRDPVVRQVAYGWPTDSPYFEWKQLAESDQQREQVPYESVNRATVTPDFDLLHAEYRSRAIPGSQAETLQRCLIAERLMRRLGIYSGGTWAMNELRDVISMASTETLEQARQAAFWTISGVLRSHAYTPAFGHVRDQPLDVREILEPYGGDQQRFFASPALFPLVAFLIGHHVWNMRRELKLRESPDHGLLALAIDRLRKRPPGRREQFDAVVLFVLAFEGATDFVHVVPSPAHEKTVQLKEQAATEILNRTMKPVAEP